MEKVCVICLCYNHRPYVKEALDSVVRQDYRNVELIAVDDASTDNSMWEIEQFKLKHPDFPMRTLYFSENLGNTRAFNKALMQTNAHFIIDLAADDILLPNRISEGVRNLRSNKKVAVNFANAELVDPDGNHLSFHYPLGEYGRSTVYVPEGAVYSEILKRYFICPPSMMYDAGKLKELGGYNEELAYEDFDVMLRLARVHPFSYTDKVLAKKRELPNSMGKKQYHRSTKQLASTYQILRANLKLLKSKEEQRAFRIRTLFELKQSIIHLRLIFSIKFFKLVFLSFQPLH